MAAIQRSFLVLPNTCVILKDFPRATTHNSYLAGEVVDLSAGTVRSPVASGAWGAGLIPVGVALQDAVESAIAQVLLLVRSTAYALNKTNNAGAAVATAQSDIGDTFVLYRTTGSVTTVFSSATNPHMRGVAHRGDIAEPIGNVGGYIYCAPLTPIF
jgi:hypothetical protein